MATRGWIVAIVVGGPHGEVSGWLPTTAPQEVVGV